jgi:hypothetical protein
MTDKLVLSSTITDPFTGLAIPCDPMGNIRWRQSLLKESAPSESRRRSLKNACAESPVWFISFACLTYHQKWVDNHGEEHAVMGPAANVPFIPWHCQVAAIKDLYDCIVNGVDACVRKSRDMGASWIVVGLFQWFWQFRPNTTFMHISRKEDLVDKKGDMDSLFEKHRYLLRWQPEWLRPRKIKDRWGILENNENGCVIVGESTTGNAGQASRKTAIHVDEAARVDSLESLDSATADTTACRIFNSTPNGPNTHYKRIRIDFETGRRRGKVITLPWWLHPQKGRGATEVLDPIKKVMVHTSAWYSLQVARRSAKDVAMNLDMDDDAAGDLFFDVAELEQHRQRFCREPLFKANLHIPPVEDHRLQAMIRARDPKAATLIANSLVNPWRFWIPLAECRMTGLRRLPQDDKYVISGDPSEGVGYGEAVFDITSVNLGMIVAKFADAYTIPERMADIIAFMAMWVGGLHGLPLVIFEKNGGCGARFGKRLQFLGYQRMYHQYVEDERTRKKTRKWGWYSSGGGNSRDGSKALLLGEYRQALKIPNATTAPSLINPCEEAIEQAKKYTFNEEGRIESPTEASSELGGGRGLHGDHVIADALAVLGRKEWGSGAPGERILPGTAAYRRRARTMKNREREMAEMDL